MEEDAGVYEKEEYGMEERGMDTVAERWWNAERVEGGGWWVEERGVSVWSYPDENGGDAPTTPTPSTPPRRGGGGMGVRRVRSDGRGRLASGRDGVAERRAMFDKLTMRRRAGAEGRVVEAGEVTSWAGLRAGWVSKPKRVELAKAWMLCWGAAVERRGGRVGRRGWEVEGDGGSRGGGEGCMIHSVTSFIHSIPDGILSNV